MTQTDPERSQTRRDWSKLRHDFYRAGRSLWITSQMEVGALTFGYAIEMSLKHLFFESRCNTPRELLNSHDLKALTAHAVAKRLIPAGRFSEDFLDYANSTFRARYPKWLAGERNETTQRGHVPHFDIVYLASYDDAVLALEDAVLTSASSAPEASILAIAAKNLATRETGLFAGNRAVIPRIEGISALVEAEFTAYDETLKGFLGGSQHKDALRDQIANNQRQKILIQDHVLRLPDWILDPTDERVKLVVEGPSASSFVNRSRSVLDEDGKVVSAIVRT